MRRSEPSLTITGELIGTGLVLVAQDAHTRSVGLASLEPLNDRVFDLLHLFVEPDAIGVGVGKALFQAIADLARERGAKMLSILSDPNAATFYERMGATRIGDAPSDAIPGRLLPLLRYDLTTDRSRSAATSHPARGRRQYRNWRRAAALPAETSWPQRE